MTDKVQVGLRVDAEVYEEFKQHVKDRRGRWQGVGGDELENAIRHYIHFGADKPLPDLFAEFNDRLQRVEGAVGAASADGGTDTSGADSHTHAPSRVEAARDEKPSANAATEKKIAYLAEQVMQREGASGEIQQIPEERLREVVKDEYGFRSDTAKRYVDELRDHFGLVEHPNNDVILVTEANREEIIRSELDDNE